MDGLQWKNLWKWMIWGTPILGPPLTNHLLSGMYSHAETVWHVWRLLVSKVCPRFSLVFNFSLPRTTQKGVTPVLADLSMFNYMPHILLKQIIW